MKAKEAREAAYKVRDDARAKERKLRDGIETDMNHVYDFINKCANAGNFSCGFPVSEISLSAEAELRRNGYKIEMTNSIGGKIVSVNWKICR